MGLWKDSVPDYLGTYHPDVRFRAQFIARRAKVENSMAEGKVFANFAK